MKGVDEAFADYLNTYEADEMFNNFSDAIREAFIAGYKLAGGKIPLSQPVMKLVPGNARCAKDKV